MIERQGKQRTLMCDVCGETFDQVDQSAFSQMVASAKEQGWSVKPDSEGTYTHSCPKCLRTSGLEHARCLFGKL